MRFHLDSLMRTYNMWAVSGLVGYTLESIQPNVSTSDDDEGRSRASRRAEVICLEARTRRTVGPSREPAPLTASLGCAILSYPPSI